MQIFEVDEVSKAKQQSKAAKQSKAKQSNFYLLTKAGYVADIQLTWACGITACALRTTSEYSFTDPGGWTAELAVGLWLVVPTAGIRTQASRPRMI